MKPLEIKKILVGLVLITLCVIFLFFSFFLSNYPVKYKNFIREYAKEYSLNENLVFSVINVESGFKKDCVSSSNAKGLMQLLDSTAQEISNKLQINHFDIFDPETNINFGCFYLRYLIDYYSGNIKNALCAYNAGLSNVNKWLQDKSIAPDGTNLINIPFGETSNYLNKIQSNQKIYKLIYSIK